MSAPTKNSNLAAARAAKEDEFYTQLTDIEKEMYHYRSHFAGKVIYLNCDDPATSQFFHFFAYSFEFLGLKKLIATSYNQGGIGTVIEYDGDRNGNLVPDPEEITAKPLMGDGDFRSDECIELLKQADIVVTNPPFSLFREYVAQLIDFDKKFIIIGSMNAVTGKGIWPLIKTNKMWLGHNNGDMVFRVPDHYPSREHRFWVDDSGQKWRSLGNVCWFTNLDHSKRHDEIILFKTYDPAIYPFYDNFDGIEVATTKDIPADYDGVMGVPITFLGKHNPEQFEIVGITTSHGGMQSKRYPKHVQVNIDGSMKESSTLNGAPAVKVLTPPVGKPYCKLGSDIFVLKYHRILVRRKV